MDLTKKYTAICEDTGEEITGYLVIAEGNINKGVTYICPETSIVEFKGTPEENVPIVALGPFYRVISDTVAPASESKPTHLKDAEVQLLQRYKDAMPLERLIGLLQVLDKHGVHIENTAAAGLDYQLNQLQRYQDTGLKPAQIEDFVHVFKRFGIDLANSNPSAADEFLSEMAAYRKSGLSAAFLNEVMETLREHGIVFHSGDPKEQVEKWLERMRWHVKKVDELAEENKRLSGLAEANLQLKKENQRLKCEVAGYRFSKTESLKKQILRFMNAVYVRDVESFRSNGVAMDFVAHKLSLEQAIMAVFQDCALNLAQCEDLLNTKFTLLDRVQSMLYKNLPEGKKPIFSESDISDAIYAVAHEMAEKRCKRKA